MANVCYSLKVQLFHNDTLYFALPQHYFLNSMIESIFLMPIIHITYDIYSRYITYPVDISANSIHGF